MPNFTETNTAAINAIAPFLVPSAFFLNLLANPTGIARHPAPSGFH